MTKPELEVTLKSIEALQMIGEQIGVRLVEVDKLLVAAGELLATFKLELEQTRTLADVDTGDKLV